MSNTWQDEICHFGIKKQKWGIRNYQNEDGSLTPAGRERYLKKYRDDVTKGLRSEVGRNGGTIINQGYDSVLRKASKNNPLISETASKIRSSQSARNKARSEQARNSYRIGNKNGVNQHLASEYEWETDDLVAQNILDGRTKAKDATPFQQKLAKSMKEEYIANKKVIDVEQSSQKAINDVISSQVAGTKVKDVHVGKNSMYNIPTSYLLNQAAELYNDDQEDNDK